MTIKAVCRGKGYGLKNDVRFSAPTGKNGGVFDVVMFGAEPELAAEIAVNKRYKITIEAEEETE